MRDGSASIRGYRHPEDYEPIGDFLVKTYGAPETHHNWLQPRWEYMHHHPYLDAASLGRIGVWEDSGEIVGAVHYEHKVVEAFFQIDPAHSHLKKEMLEYAGEHLAGENEKGRFVQVFIDGADGEFESIATECGFEKRETGAQPMFRLPLEAHTRRILSVHQRLVRHPARSVDAGSIIWYGVPLIPFPR